MTIVVSQTEKVNIIYVRKPTITIVLDSSKKHKAKDVTSFFEKDRLCEIQAVNLLLFTSPSLFNGPKCKRRLIVTGDHRS